jgi:hypothetical protein
VVKRRQRTGCWAPIDPVSNHVCLAWKRSVPGPFPVALDVELALRQSTGGGVGVCLHPAHLPGPWTCDMRGLMYFSIWELPS